MLNYTINKTSKVLKAAILGSALISASISFAAEKNNKSSNKLKSDSVVAEYNGNKVKLKDVKSEFNQAIQGQSEMQNQKFEDLDKNVQENIIKSYVQSRILESEAEKSGIRESKEYKDKLEKIKKQVALQLFIENQIKSKVTEDKIKAKYNKFKKDISGKKEVKARHILVDSKEKAEEIKNKLDKGSNFADLAKEYSKDQSSKVKGGELGYFSEGQLVPEFESKAFSMKKGQVSAPVKTQFGYHIIKVEDKRPVKVPSYDEIKSSIEGRLSREFFESYMDDLNKKYNVKVKI